MYHTHVKRDRLSLGLQISQNCQTIFLRITYGSKKVQNTSYWNLFCTFLDSYVILKKIIWQWLRELKAKTYSCQLQSLKLLLCVSKPRSTNCSTPWQWYLKETKLIWQMTLIYEVRWLIMLKLNELQGKKNPSQLNKARIEILLAQKEQKSYKYSNP